MRSARGYKILILLVFLAGCSWSHGFGVRPFSVSSRRSLRPFAAAASDDDNGAKVASSADDKTKSNKKEQTSSSSPTVTQAYSDVAKKAFPEAEFLEFLLAEHRPLGCTVEESLAHPMEKHVFVSKVVDGGFAQQAGLEVGDSIVAVSGIFDELTCVIGVGIEQVRSLVRGRAKGEPLGLQVARGTDVLDQHESALVTLCMTPGANDQETDECLVSIMSGAYVDEEDYDDDEAMVSTCDDGTECMLDDLFNMWDEDMPAAPKVETEAEGQDGNEPSPAPWSSRSSGSGTYVRDPATGKMRNIEGKQ